jgi:hypothetical protein
MPPARPMLGARPRCAHGSARRHGARPTRWCANRLRMCITSGSRRGPAGIAAECRAAASGRPLGRRQRFRKAASNRPMRGQVRGVGSSEVLKRVDCAWMHCGSCTAAPNPSSLQWRETHWFFRGPRLRQFGLRPNSRVGADRGAKGKCRSTPYTRPRRWLIVGRMHKLARWRCSQPFLSHALSRRRHLRPRPPAARDPTDQ